MACFNKSSLSFSPVKTIKIIGSELNSDHTDYVIKVTVGNYHWKVYKRYSEFLKLNDSLPAEVKDAAKLLLPKKQFFGSNSEAVVKDRQHKLEIYLQCLFRSLPSVSHPLLNFLSFDVYEIHGITESLAEELYNEGDDILDRKKPYNLSILQLHAICRRMELPEPTSAGNPRRDMGHLLDFINQLKSLKVVGNKEKLGLSDIHPNNLQVQFQHFKSLHSLQLNNCNFQNISMSCHLKKNLKKLKVSNSLNFISEVLLAGIQWENHHIFPVNILNELSWSCLETADFSSNKIQTIDTSLKLMPKLKTLNMSHNSLEKLDMLEGLQALSHLDISHNKLDDTSLSNLQLTTTITTLDVSHNKLKSFSALVGLKTLVMLNASFNEVEKTEELQCLGKLRSILELKLNGNPISLKPGYRLLVLQIFSDNFNHIILDSQKVSEKEKDAILVRLALQVSNENSLKSDKENNLNCKEGIPKKNSSEILRGGGPNSKACSSSSSLPCLGVVDITMATESLPVYEDAGVNLNQQSSPDEELVEKSIKTCTNFTYSDEGPSDDPIKLSADQGQNTLDETEGVTEVTDDGIASVMRSRVATKGVLPHAIERSDTQESSSQALTINQDHHHHHHVHSHFPFGLQKIEHNIKSTSLKQSRRRKYFLLPETLPNHNNRSLMSVLEDTMDPPDSFGLPEVEYRHNNVGHIMWCSALTNLRKSSHAQERPVCVCVTPFKVHIFKVDQLRGDAGIPKLRYFTFVLISDIHCFMIGSRHLYLRIVDRFHPSHVIILLTFNRIKTENFLEHVKKASRRNIPFLDDYEDPVVINSSLDCEKHISEFLTNFESSLKDEEQEATGSHQLQFYQLAQLTSDSDNSHHSRTSSVVFTGGYLYVLFQDFAHFPKSSNHILEFIPSRPAQHQVAAVFPLTSNIIIRIRQYDGETIDSLEKTSDVPDFIGYGLELHFSIQQKIHLLDLRWPTSCTRREFMVHFHKAFTSRHPSSIHDLHHKLENILNGEDKNKSNSHESKFLFRRTYVIDDKMFHSNLSC